MDGPWKLQPYNADYVKSIAITGPGTLLIQVDFDDVNHDEVEAALPRIVYALNEEWS